MRYFKMRQDLALPYRVGFREFDITGGRRVFEKEEADMLRDTSLVCLTGNGDEVCPDYIESPVCLVSDGVRRVMELYEDGLVFKKVILLHKEAARQERFAHVLCDRIPALSGRACPAGREEGLVLDRKKTGGHHVFRLAGSRTGCIIVSLAVTESLLRRQVQGVLFQEVEVE